MASEPRAILELEDGSRHPICGRAMLMAIAFALHQEAINAVEIGTIEVGFQSGRLHPLRLTSSLQTVNLPSIRQRPEST